MRRIDSINKLKEKVNFFESITKKGSGAIGAILFALPIVGTIVDRMMTGETADQLKLIVSEGDLLVKSNFFEKQDDVNLIINTNNLINKFLKSKINENSSDEDIESFISLAYDVMNRLSALPQTVDHNLNYFESFIDSAEGVIGANKSSMNARGLLKTLDPNTISTYLSKVRAGGGVLQGLAMGLGGVLTGLTGGLAVPVVTAVTSAVTGVMSIAQDFRFLSTEASGFLNKDLIILQDKVKAAKSGNVQQNNVQQNKTQVINTKTQTDNLSEFSGIDLTI